MTDRPVILWFRRDLRLGDNPALAAAIETGRPVIAAYIHDPKLDGRAMGGASAWWLDKSLRALAADLSGRGSSLVVRAGDAETEIEKLVEETKASDLFLNRMFEPIAWARDARLAETLKGRGVQAHGFNATSLATPGAVCTQAGEPFKVFTPFNRALWDQARPRQSRCAPDHIRGPDSPMTGINIDSLALHPRRPDWSTGFSDWTPGEAGALVALDRFLDQALADYSGDRDRPDREGTSRLSPHLHFGEIDPWRVATAARTAAEGGEVPYAQAEKLCAELAWREFSIQLLTAFPTLASENYKNGFDRMAWRDDPAGLAAWTQGRTGYPIVDAGMRQLWATGWMHNRVRMIVASFLIKDLLIDWREGERWFWDCLVDADAASNAQNWQWVAGSGADASPFFRIFNPITQGEKFDPRGDYVRRWVPELAALPADWIHRPWTAPPMELAAAGVGLGETYPAPIVDHATARNRALDALKATRG
ncbi:MAG: deoxyribodipyrimidine photo-lyase [Caulobacterales bacterium]|nr:deoxyribodipyrimidine photo-lyase [Caulobacterales bacterium]